MFEFFAFGLLDERGPKRLRGSVMKPTNNLTNLNVGEKRQRKKLLRLLAHLSGTGIALGLLSSIALSSILACTVSYIYSVNRALFRADSILEYT